MSVSCGFWFPVSPLTSSACHSHTQGNNSAQRNNSQIRQEGDWRYKQGEGGSREHSSWRWRHGGCCLSPKNSSILHLRTGTGSQPHFCFLAHHPHGETKNHPLWFPSASGTAWIWEEHTLFVSWPPYFSPYIYSIHPASLLAFPATGSNELRGIKFFLKVAV